MTNVIQEQTADDRKKRQEQIKKEKDERRKSIGVAQKLKMKTLSKKQELSPPESTENGSHQIKKSDVDEQLEGEDNNQLKVLNLKNTTPQRSRTPVRSRGPYNEQDPLHMCHLNDQCHQTNNIHQRCRSHKIDKEEMKIKQKVF